MACKLLVYLTSGLRGFGWNVISYYFESERGLPPFEAPRYFCKRVRVSARMEYRARYYRGFLSIVMEIVFFFSRIERNNLFLESENINSAIVNIQVTKDVQNFRFTFKCNLTNY